MQNKFFVPIAVIVITGAMGLGYWLGFNFFMKTPVPTMDITKQPIMACYEYADGSVGDCNKYQSTLSVDGTEYFKVDDLGSIELVKTDRRALFYIIKKDK